MQSSWEQLNLNNYRVLGRGSIFFCVLKLLCSIAYYALLPHKNNPKEPF